MNAEEEGGVALTVEPLLAVAGGILGGALLVGLAWVVMWRRPSNLTGMHGGRR